MIKILKGFFERKMVVMLVAIVLVFVVLFNSGMFGGKDVHTHITCVGDSLTYGSGVLKNRDTDSYPAQLQAKLGTSYQVEGFGLRNATASESGDLPYLQSKEYKASLKSNPDIVLVMIGTNDSKTYNWNPEDYKAGLEKIVTSYKELKSQPTVYLLKSPYCYATDGTDIAQYDIQPAVVKDEVLPIIDEVAAEQGVEVIDLYEVTEGEDSLYTDGIHFNKKGYSLLADTIEDKIK